MPLDLYLYEEDYRAASGISSASMFNPRPETVFDQLVFKAAMAGFAGEP